MAVITGEYTLAPERQRQSIGVCNHQLSNGRTCCHVKEVPAIGYEPCPLKQSYGPGADDRCWHAFAIKDKSHRHSHTWQLGDARYAVTGGKLVDLETGEFRGNAEFGTGEIIQDIRAGRASWTEAEKQANARRVLRLYGSNLPDDDDYVVPVSDVTKAAIMVEWHYHGPSGWSYGQDQDGHNYEMSPEGRLKRIYSLNERSETVTYAQRFGAARAAGKYGIPAGTIRSWMTRKS
jgi:hypothetical protein